MWGGVWGSFFGVVWFGPVRSGLFQLIPVYSGLIWLSLFAPGVDHVLLSPDLDEGSPSGCLW